MRGKKTVLSDRELLIFNRLVKKHYDWMRGQENGWSAYKVVDRLRRVRRRCSYAGLLSMHERGASWEHIEMFINTAGKLGLVWVYPFTQRGLVTESLMVAKFEEQLVTMSDEQVRRALLLESV